ncbi:hypothetical protein [Streptomyces sp. NPDC017529]|uniref:hypothetical protein n=1 Tax=Streptomyces sp. NPDC017529 TaxID=3365000 RepID=UPI0037A15F79
MRSSFKSAWGLFAALVLVIAAGTPAWANTADDDPDSEATTATITAGDLADPDHLITCKINSFKPFKTGNVITGLGTMSSCTPNRPETCRTEADLLRYYPETGNWLVIANGNVSYQCPLPKATSNAKFTCHPTSRNWSYMTRVYGTIVHDNRPKSRHLDSDVFNIKCV